MSEIPILQRVYQETDIYGLGEDVAETQPWGVDMSVNHSGYTLVTSVVRSGPYKSYGDLTIAVKAEGGVLADNPPNAVEISPTEKPGTMILRVDSSESYVDGSEKVFARTYEPPKQERLLLPGDEGFAVFEELHEEVRQIGSRIGSIMNIAGVSDWTTFSMSPFGSSASFKSDGSAAYHRLDYFSIGTTQTQPKYPHMLELTMNTIGKTGEWPKSILYTNGELHKAGRYQSSPKPYWKEGPVVYFNNKPTKELDFDELMAFSALGNLIQNLAPKNPYI